MKKLIKRKIERLKTGWYIWLFPLFALGISAWFLYDYYRQQGPRVKIAFEDATGMQPEKTTVRFRGIAIGTVMDVYISDDGQDVIAEVLLRKDAERFAVEGSRFSLITPKVSLQGVSGLSTLFEGPYIAVLPGESKRKRTFFRAQGAATVDPQDDTSIFLLVTDNAESVSQGDAVTFRGMKIGSVSKLFFDKPAQNVNLQINIENRYVRLVRANTVFWRKAGIHAKIGLFNSEIKVNSLDTIMNGGVEMATPSPAGPKAKAWRKFALAAEPPKDYVKWRPTLGWSDIPPRSESAVKPEVIPSDML